MTNYDPLRYPTSYLLFSWFTHPNEDFHPKVDGHGVETTDLCTDCTPVGPRRTEDSGWIGEFGVEIPKTAHFGFGP
jgi:hypothetical protein